MVEGQLKWVSKPYWRKDADGKAWFGRGYVQITHKVNYAKAGALIGVDLVDNPSLALDPVVAARVLVQGSQAGIFTGTRLADYLDDVTPDYVNARRVVNGPDRAQDIAKLAEGYEKTVNAWATTAPKVPVTDAASAPATGFVAAFVVLIRAMFGGR